MIHKVYLPGRQYDYPYSMRCREAFIEQTSIDPMDLGDEAPYNKQWRQFRYDIITELVNDFLVPAAKNKNKNITAAVFPNWESVRQQWHNWNLDGFLPMLYHGFYNEDINWIGDQVAFAKRKLKPEQKLFSGLFMPHLKTADELQNAILIAKDNQANGFALFEGQNLKKEYFEILKTLK